MMDEVKKFSDINKFSEFKICPCTWCKEWALCGRYKNNINCECLKCNKNHSKIREKFYQELFVEYMEEKMK